MLFLSWCTRICELQIFERWNCVTGKPWGLATLLRLRQSRDSRSDSRRKIGQRERICKASSRIIPLLEATFAPTEKRKWWKVGGEEGVYCAKSSRPSEVDGRNESVRDGRRRSEKREKWKLGSKYGPVSPTSWIMHPHPLGANWNALRQCDPSEK